MVPGWPALWCDALWSEIDLRRARITISHERGSLTKMGREHSLPLAAKAVAVLKDMKAAQGRRATQYLFGTPLKIRQRARNRLAKAACMKSKDNRGTLHRVRSTFLTALAEWNVPLEVAQALAGHVNPFVGSRAHYVPSTPTPAQVATIQRWADSVDEMYVLS